MAVIILVFVAISLVPKKQNESEYNYEKIQNLFTPAERSFLGARKLAVKEDYQIFGKVRVADVLTPVKGQAKGVWQKAFNKISAKHFDYVLCRNDDLSVVCVIELNDKSHKKESRRKRDEFLNGICDAAGLQMISVDVKRAYKVSEIQELLPKELSQETVQTVAVAKSADVAKSPKAQTKLKADVKDCPKCQSKMVVRTAKKGKNAGNKFLACTSFPKCRYLEATDS